MIATIVRLRGLAAARPTVFFPFFLIIFLLAACSRDEPQVSFQNLEDGQRVASPVSVVMEAENFTIEPAGELIPKDDNHRHFGDGSTIADLELASGEHTLCLQAADGAHVALQGDGLTHEISLTVP
jgi:hypothetical protein